MKVAVMGRLAFLYATLFAGAVVIYVGYHF